MKKTLAVAYITVFFFLASCAFYTREISPPYKSRVENLVRQITNKPYSVHIIENYYAIAMIDLHTRSISLNATLAERLVNNNRGLLRAILAHEIAHDTLDHRRSAAADTPGFQQLEFEADQEALNILKNAGYDLWDYRRMMSLFKELEDKNPRGFYEQYYSSHAYSGERLEKIEQTIATLSPEIARQDPIEETPEKKSKGSQVPLIEANPVTRPRVKAEKPEWKVGYEWKYTWKRPGTSGSFTREIIREDTFEGVPSYVVRTGKNENFYTKDVLGALAQMSAGTLTIKRDSPRQLFTWPLELGKEWRNSYFRENIQEKRTQTFDFRVVVANVETVRVPAGTFDAFKIQSYEFHNGKLLQEHWYSPTVKWFVKERIYEEGGVLERDLISFKVD